MSAANTPRPAAADAAADQSSALCGDSVFNSQGEQGSNNPTKRQRIEETPAAKNNGDGDQCNHDNAPMSVITPDMVDQMGTCLDVTPKVRTDQASTKAKKCLEGRLKDPDSILQNGNLTSITSKKIVNDTLKDLRGLSSFAKGFLCKANIDDESFISDVIKHAKDIREDKNTAVCKLFDFDTVVRAREASEEIFEAAQCADKGIKQDLHLIYAWQETYLPTIKDSSKEMLTKEVPLEDSLQEVSFCLIAIIAAEFGGLDMLYKEFRVSCEKTVENMDVSKDIRQAFTECMKEFLKRRIESDKGTWAICEFQENHHDIPPEYTGIFPETVYLLEYVPEGLSMSFERIAMALLYPDIVTFSRQINAGGLFGSHLILPRQCSNKNGDGGSARYTLYEDFLFASIPLGDRRDNVLFVSMEGRCITSRAGALFLTVPINAQIRPCFSFFKDDGDDTNSLFRRRFGQMQVVCMAKYRLTPAQFHKLYECGFTVDHLTKQYLYGQATLLMIADWWQQASNKRPICRNTFTSQSLYGKKIYTHFWSLSEDRQTIARTCKEAVEQRGLKMVRLEEGYMKSISAKVDSGEVFEAWTDVVICDDTFFFEDEGCIWMQTGDKWIFLEDVMDITRRTPYRCMTIGNVSHALVHCSVLYTKLCAALRDQDGQLLKKQGSNNEHAFLHTFKMGEIARLHGNRVQFKAAWRSRKGDAVQRLVVDHIDGNTGNNQLDNLRFVTSQQNTAIALGKPRRAIIYSNCTDVTDDDPIILIGETSVELVDQMLDAMATKNFPQYSKGTLLGWIAQKQPRSTALKGKIIIEDVTDAAAADDDADEDGCSLNLQRWWYVAVYQNTETERTEYQAYYGKNEMVSEIRARLRLSQPEEYLKENVFRDFMSDSDESKRMKAIQERLYSDGDTNRYDEKLVDLFCSRHGIKSTMEYIVSIPQIILKEECIGFRGIIATLQKSTAIVQYAEDQCRQGSRSVEEVLKTLSKSCIDNERKYGHDTSSVLNLQFGVSIKSAEERPFFGGNGETFRVIFENGSERLLACRDIFSEFFPQREGPSNSPKLGTVYGWVKDAVTCGNMHTRLQQLGIVSIESSMDGNSGGKDQNQRNKKRTLVKIVHNPTGSTQEPIVERFDSQTNALAFLMNQGTVKNRFANLPSLSKYLRTNNNMLIDGDYTYTLDDDDDGTSKKANKQRAFIDVYAIVQKDKLLEKADKNTVLSHVDSWDEQLPDFVRDLSALDAMLGSGMTAEKVKTGFEDKSLICLKFNGYTKSDKFPLVNFLTNVMKLSNVDKVIHLLQDGGRSSEISEWCHLTFSAKTMAKAKGKSLERTVEFKYRAFVAGYDSSLASETTALERAMGDMLRGNGKTSSGNCIVLKDSKTWKRCKQNSKTSIKKWEVPALNAVVKQIWKEFKLKLKIKSVAHTKGSDDWHMCAIQSTGKKKENHLEYSDDAKLDLASVDKVPFMYLPLSMDILPMESRGSCGTKEMPCYLVVVTQRKVSDKENTSSE